jgi:hypothetical protein
MQKTDLAIIFCLLSKFCAVSCVEVLQLLDHVRLLDSTMDTLLQFRVMRIIKIHMNLTRQPIKMYQLH